MCCSMTQLSVNYIRTSASVIGRSLRGQGCGNCCPGSGFFGPQSSGAIVAAVQSFAVWWYHSLRPRADPLAQHSRFSLRASSGRDVCVSPTAGARLCCQHNTPGHAFHQLRQWVRELHSSLFDRCTLHFDPRNLPFVCVNSNQAVNLSSSLYVRRCSKICLENL